MHRLWPVLSIYSNFIFTCLGKALGLSVEFFLDVDFYFSDCPLRWGIARTASPAVGNLRVAA